MIKEISKQIIATSTTALNAGGIGKNIVFNEEGKVVIDLSIEIMDKLIYPGELVIYGNETSYFIVKGTSPLYLGMIDAEGIENTIINDVNETSDFMNTMIAIANEDIDFVTNSFSNPVFFENFISQMSAGAEKGIKNGHY